MAENTRLDTFVYTAKTHEFTGTLNEIRHLCPRLIIPKPLKGTKGYCNSYIKQNRVIHCGQIKIKVLTIDGDYVIGSVLSTSGAFSAPGINEMIRTHKSGITIIHE